MNLHRLTNEAQIILMILALRIRLLGYKIMNLPEAYIKMIDGYCNMFNFHRLIPFSGYIIDWFYSSFLNRNVIEKRMLSAHMCQRFFF